MQIYSIVFSPTGGTERVAQILCGAMGADVTKVDLSCADIAGSSVPGDAIAVIAMPSFGGRAPKTAIERLKKVKGNGAKAVVVAVYGNRAQEDTLIEMADAAKDCGFAVIAGIAAVAEHSIAHQYASGRPDKADEAELLSFAEKIKARLNDRSEPAIPGNRPYKKAGAGLVPKANANCVSCGVCAAKCPVGAIDKADPKRTDKTVCINCMRCAAVCPANARAADPLMVKLVGFALKKACSARKENVLYL